MVMRSGQQGLRLAGAATLAVAVYSVAVATMLPTSFAQIFAGNVLPQAPPTTPGLFPWNPSPPLADGSLARVCENLRADPAANAAAAQVCRDVTVSQDDTPLSMCRPTAVESALASAFDNVGHGNDGNVPRRQLILAVCGLTAWKGSVAAGCAEAQRAMGASLQDYISSCRKATSRLPLVVTSLGSGSILMGSSSLGSFAPSHRLPEPPRKIILRIPPPSPAAPEPPPPTCNSYDGLQKSRCLDLFNQGKSTFESFDVVQVPKTCRLFSGKTYTCMSTERTPSVTKDCCKIMSHTCLCEMRKEVSASANAANFPACFKNMKCD